MAQREIAWRLFAAELNDSDLEQQGEGEKAPSYLVTPLGARVNRIVAVGVITDIENTGTEDEPLWRARMADPTGTFYISAGQFQQEAARSLSKLKPPVFAAVIGKFRTYSPEPGVTYVSVRPEAVKKVDAELRDFWVLEACKSLRRRIEAYEEASKMDPPKRDELAALGYGDLAEGLAAAVEHYPDVDLERYRTMLVDSLRYLLPESHKAEEREPASTEEKPVEYIAKEEAEDVADAELSPTADEQKILKILADVSKDRRGASEEDVAMAAKKDGFSKERVDELLGSLLDKGLVFEPKMGRFMVS
jgi:RPA family protein